MDSDRLQQSYEQVPYPDLCYTQTHLDRLATLATLLGLQPPPITQCRVLELGCASGGNLIPMAYGLPGSQFLGIDFAASQIEAGQRTIEALGLSNIQLQQGDILDLAPDFGSFDYIIAHGVYSWVPEAVRDRLLAICKNSLATDGIAYVSYNTYPGWHMLGGLRQMMLYHTRHAADPGQRVDKARELLEFLGSATGREDPYSTFSSAYGQMLTTYNSFVSREREKEQSGYELLLHDELELVNDPVYFHQFASHAASHGLQYLVEADFARVVASNFPAEVAQTLLKMSSDIIELEQYMDFLRNRTLRQTLLCHDHVAVKRSLRPDAGWMSTFYVASHAYPVSAEINLHDDSVAQFRGPDGATLSIDHPISKAAMLHLARVSPQALRLDQLYQAAHQHLHGEPVPPAEPWGRDAQTLVANILKAYSYSMRLVELHLYAPHFVLEAGPLPLASKLARHQVAHGAQKVSNLRHERVRLDHTSQLLLPYLDGDHDRGALLEILVDHAQHGQINLEHEGRPVEDPAEIRQILAQEMELALLWLGRAALLEG